MSDQYHQCGHYKDSTNIEQAHALLFEDDFTDFCKEKIKIPIDRKTVPFRDLSSFSNLSEILANLANSSDIKNDLNIIDDFCYGDDCRPDPNQLLKETEIFPTLIQIIDGIVQSESIDSELVCLVLRILSHLSLANLRSDLIPNDIFFEQIITFFDINDSPFNSSIHIALCDFFYNFTSDSSFQYDQCNAIIETGLIEQLSSICIGTSSSEEKIIIYKLSCNLTQVLVDNNDIDSLNAFMCLIRPLINSLSLSSEQDFAIELLSYILYSPECCIYSQIFPINESILQSLKCFSKDYISDAFIAINSIIQHTVEDLPNSIFVKKDLISFALESIPKISVYDARPLFLYLDLLTDECMNDLATCSGISTLIDWATDSPIKIRRKALYVLAHIVDNNWEEAQNPDIVEQLQEMVRIIIENMLCLSTRKKMRVLEIFIDILNSNPDCFFSMAGQTDFAECLEGITEVEDSKEILDMIELLNNALNSIEKDE